MEPNNSLCFSTEEVIRMLQGLKQRIEKLELQQHSFSQPPIVVQNMTVYRLDTEKVQFNLDEISVQELNGTLNIGINRNKLSEKAKETTQATLPPEPDATTFPSTNLF